MAGVVAITGTTDTGTDMASKHIRRYTLRGSSDSSSGDAHMYLASFLMRTQAIWVRANGLSIDRLFDIRIRPVFLCNMGKGVAVCDGAGERICFSPGTR